MEPVLSNFKKSHYTSSKGSDFELHTQNSLDKEKKHTDHNENIQGWRKSTR